MTNRRNLPPKLSQCMTEHRALKYGTLLVLYRRHVLLEYRSVYPQPFPFPRVSSAVTAFFASIVGRLQSSSRRGQGLLRAVLVLRASSCPLCLLLLAVKLADDKAGTKRLPYATPHRRDAARMQRRTYAMPHIRDAAHTRHGTYLTGLLGRRRVSPVTTPLRCAPLCPLWFEFLRRFYVSFVSFVGIPEQPARGLNPIPKYRDSSVARDQPRRGGM